MKHPEPTKPRSPNRPGVLPRIDRALVALLQWLIRGYQRLLSPMIGGQCRFHPTCSCYAAQSLAEHGAVKGLGLTIWRLLRCQPFATGGFDPVPGSHSQSSTTRELDPHATH